MKKKIFALALGLVMALTAFTACGKDEVKLTTTAPAGEEQQNEATGGTKRVALVMSHLTNAFTTTFSEAAKEEAESIGVDLTVFDGKKDVATQIDQIESCIAQGYDGIMVEPVSVDGIIPAVKKANEADIPVLAVIQKMSDQSLAAGYVGGNDKGAGKLEMEKAVEALGGKGSIAVLYGPMGSDAQLIRKEGYDEVLADYPDVKIVFEQTANWVTDEALKITENWLASGTGIDAIVSQNDSMAIGAAKAISDAGKTESIPVYGVDATPDGLDAIEKGTMSGSVSQDTAGMGRLSVQTIVKVLDGEAVEDEVLTQAIWVTKENVAEFK
ncbi:MAG: sugar ABC transporter substrate-binding protein [Fastidiosipilaceae bacterium]|jgi:inositol transport system substrate-binding protein